MHDLKIAKNKKIKKNRRKHQKQPREWKKILQRLVRVSIAICTGFMLLLGTMLTGRMLLESGYFAVSQVQIKQQVRVSEEEILESSDIRIGDSLFDLDLHMIGRKIEEHPWIAKAEVERVFPDQVVIGVIEHQPRAIVDLDYLYYVDADGEIFKLLDNGDQLDFPVLTGIDREALLENAETVQTSLKMALALMNELEQRTLFNLKDISEIHYDPDDGLILYTFHGGVPVYMGTDEFKAKLNRLEQVYPDLKSRLNALAYIDLNVTDRVIVKIDVKRQVGQS